MELSSENIIELIQRIIEHLSTNRSTREVVVLIATELDIESDGVETIKDFAEDDIKMVAEFIYEEIEDKNHDEIIEKLKTNSQLKAIVEEINRVFIRRSTTVEILVEELSMKNVLDIILHQILPEGYVLGVNCFIRPHQGKSDLQKSIPIKVNAF
ncbi:MAG: hypothetical protein HC803_03985 [Saprospiraceae bacterium]|nr:hypothetical protein [Saprospiraceae bacterium]